MQITIVDGDRRTTLSPEALLLAVIQGVPGERKDAFFRFAADVQGQIDKLAEAGEDFKVEITVSRVVTPTNGARQN